MKDHPLGGHHSEKDSQKSHSPRAALVPPCPSWQYIRQILCQGESCGTGSAPAEKTPTRLEIYTGRFSLRVPSSLKLCRKALPVVTCLSCSCLIGGVWGITCSEPDSQPTKSDWF